MQKDLIIVDYERVPKTITIDNFEDVTSIHIKILSGDEVATVIRKDCVSETYDSSDCRWTDYYDGEYILNPEHIEEFNNLTGSSYERHTKYLEFKHGK